MPKSVQRELDSLPGVQVNSLSCRCREPFDTGSQTVEDAQEDVVGLVEDLDNVREIPDTSLDLVLSTVTDSS